MVDANTIIDYSYAEFKVGIDEMASQILDSGFDLDYIVCIVRGGCVPGVYLSHKLKKPLVTVSWNTRDDTEWGNETNCWIPEDIIAGKKVLVVDDIVDGGDTINGLMIDWQSSVRAVLNRDNIKIAAMYYNTSQDVKVDFFHRAIDRNIDKRWICFPWE